MTAGAVLTGGASHRMGTDKALVEVDGVAMAERVARALAAGGCAPVTFVGGDEVLMARFGRPVLADGWPGGGPVGAIITVLAAATDDTVVAACDLAHLDAATVRTLLRAAAAAGSDVDAVVTVTDRRQPMLTWWRLDRRDAIEAAWRSGRHAVHEVLDGLRIAEVTVEAAALRNVNTPADLARQDDP